MGIFNPFKQNTPAKPPVTQATTVVSTVKADIAKAEAAHKKKLEEGDVVTEEAEANAEAEEPLNPVEGEDEVADETVLDADEEPLTTEEPTKEAASTEEAAEPSKEAEDENSKEEAAAPLADIQVTPIAAPAVEIPEEIKSKPKLLGKYNENLGIATQVLNKNKVMNAGRRIDLGAGLILTEEQIYELAKKKLQPVMVQIDDRVAENLKRDAEVAAKIEENIRLKDEKVVADDLTRYQKAVDEQSNLVKSEHEIAIEALNKKELDEKTEIEEYIENEKKGIEEDATEAETVEEDAAKEHEAKKENASTEAINLKEEKTKELEDTKSKQIEETELAEKFETDSKDLESKADELEKEAAAKKLELEEKIKQVEALIQSKLDKKNALRTASKQRKVADRSYNIIDAQHAQVLGNVAILKGQVGSMKERVTAHDTKIGNYNTEGKEALISKKADASQAKTNWEAELQQMRIEEAQKQERIRIEAEEERKRIEQEKAEEEARLQREEEEREAKEKEDARLAAEKKKKEQEEAIALHEEEIARAKRLKELADEKIRIEKEAEEQHKAAALARQSRLETEEKSEKKSTGLGIGAAVGAAVGATVGGVAGLASSAAATAGDIGTSAVGGVAASKAAEPTPFHGGNFDQDKGGIPAVIPEEPHFEEAKDTSISQPSTSSKSEEDTVPTATAVTKSEPSSVEDSSPVKRRTSMVDEAIANMTPEQIARMNTPLKDLYPAEKATPEGLSRKNSISKPRSRSGSLSLFRRSKSRNNSIKQSSSEAAAAAAVAKKKADAKNMETGVVKPIAQSNASQQKESPAEALKNEPVDLGTQSIGEAKKVPIKSNWNVQEKVETSGTIDSNDDESLSELPTAKPVFTEKIGAIAATDATGPSDYDNDEFVEVSTLETIDSAEYRAHKDDPNYMIIKN